MLDLKLQVRIFNTSFIIKLFLILLLVGLIPLGELYLVINVLQLVDQNLIFAGLAATSLLGFLWGLLKTRAFLKLLRYNIHEGYYPEKDFIHYGGMITGCVFLIIPGFISDFIGFIFMLPFLQGVIGRATFSVFNIKLKDLYEYLKLYD